MPMYRVPYVSENPTTFGKRIQYSTQYFRPGEPVPEGAEEVRMTEAQVEDLRTRFPGDFPDDEPVETEPKPKQEEEPPALPAFVERFVQSNWQVAVQRVEETADDGHLAQMFAGELRREGGPRKSVLAAFEAKGFTEDD